MGMPQIEHTRHENEKPSKGPVVSRNRCGTGEEPPCFDLSRIGPALKETRESKGLSLADVSVALFVRRLTLDAIESNRWDLLPHSVYVKGYVKSYASLLDIHMDGNPRRPTNSFADPAFGLTRGGVEAKQRDIGEIPSNRHIATAGKPALKRVAVACSSVIGLILGMALTPIIRTATPIHPKDILASCQFIVTDLRRIILP
jgi:hypothetical protein